MRQQLTVKGSLRDEQVRAWLEEPIRSLGRRLDPRTEQAASLRALLRQGPDGAEAALILKLPGRTLSVSEAQPEARAALLEAFVELERLVTREGARLARADGGREPDEVFRRDLLRRMGGEAPAAEDEALLAGLEELERFVVRELRWLEASGELVAGEIDPRDVVDTAFARVFARRGAGPPREQLLRAATSALRAELARAREARQELHIEQEAREKPPEGEIFEFYQPDADLRVEDLVRGLAQTPEEIEATAELAEVVEGALAVLPPRWRQAYRLHVEGLAESSIAHALGVETEEVPGLVAYARAFLRDRLVELGLLDGPAPGRAEPGATFAEAGSEKAVRAYRQELSDRARDRHDVLSAAIGRLESALAAPAALRARPWSERVGAELRLVREAIDRHVESIEEAKGLFDEVLLAEPRLAPRIEELKRQHLSLRAWAAELARRLPGNEEFRALRQRAAELLAALRAHRAAEADLVFEAFWTDIGSVD